MNDARTVLVTGASSQLGVFLLPLLREAGYRVRALSRRVPERPLDTTPGLCWLRPEQEYGEPVDEKSRPDFLVSCGPTGLATGLVQRHPGLACAVVFSTSSVVSKAESADVAERRLVRGIAVEEERLRLLCRRLGVSLVLIRPTLIYGCGMDRNVSLLYRMGQRSGFIPVSSAATGLRQPVHAGDLAALALHALDYRGGEVLEGAACGGSALTFLDMARKVAVCGPRRARLLRLPPVLLAGAVRLLSLAGPLRGVNSAMVHRQSVDLAFDDGVFRQTLGYRPRPFEPSPTDFAVPDSARALQLPV